MDKTILLLEFKRAVVEYEKIIREVSQMEDVLEIHSLLMNQNFYAGLCTFFSYTSSCDAKWNGEFYELFKERQESRGEPGSSWIYTRPIDAFSAHEIVNCLQYRVDYMKEWIKDLEDENKDN